MAIKKVTGNSVVDFMRKNILCRFEVPSRFIFDNDTPFLNKDVHRLTEWHSITHMISTPYCPKRNGQAEASNKRLLKILEKITKENEK